MSFWQKWTQDATHAFQDLYGNWILGDDAGESTTMVVVLAAAEGHPFVSLRTVLLITSPYNNHSTTMAHPHPLQQGAGRIRPRRNLIPTILRHPNITTLYRLLELHFVILAAELTFNRWSQAAVQNEQELHPGIASSTPLFWLESGRILWGRCRGNSTTGPGARS